MTKRFLSFLLFLISVVQPAGAQESYRVWDESIEIKPGGQQFNSKVHVNGFTLSSGTYQCVSFTSLEQVEMLSVKVTKGKRLKALPQKDIILSDLKTKEFYAGVRGYFFPVTPGEFEYDFNRAGNAVLLSVLGNQPFIDTFHYNILVPPGSSLIFDEPVYKDSCFSIDSVLLPDGACRYHVSIMVQNHDGKTRHNENMLRLCISNSRQVQHAWQALNQWMKELLSLSAGANKAVADSFYAERKIDPGEKLVMQTFEGVRQSVKYIAVENGLGAYQPRPPMQVWQKREGDCKDMAQLLCALLRARGVNAFVALASFQTHAFDIDFPSVAGANHAICVVKTDSTWLCLDPTDTYGVPGLPPHYLQERNIFIINDTGCLYHIPAVKAAGNRFSKELWLTPGNNPAQGTCTYLMEGYAGNYLRWLYGANAGATAEENFNILLQKDFNNHLQKIPIQVNSQDGKSVLSFQFELPKSFYTGLPDRQLLDLSFLPGPGELFWDELSAEASSCLPYALLCVNTVHVVLPRSFSSNLVRHEHFSKEGFQFIFDATKENETTLLVQYSVHSDNIRLDEKRIQAYNEIHSLIRNMLGQTLVVR